MQIDELGYGGLSRTAAHQTQPQKSSKSGTDNDFYASMSKMAAGADVEMCHA
jgi:hypothetical protein